MVAVITGRLTGPCMRKGIVILLVIATVVMTASWFRGEAQAIPAFARKYNMSCSNCHVSGFPKLNDFGNRFRDQGYQMNTDEDEPANTHFAYWPISLRTSIGYQYSSASRLAVGSPATDRAYATSGSFGFTGLDILSFGTITKNISYGVVYLPGLRSAGFNTGSTTSDSDLEYAFVRFNNIADSSLLNVRLGKHELDLPFSEKRSPTLNSLFAIYHYVPGSRFGGAISNPSGNPSYANANDLALGDNHLGVELMGWKETEATDGTFRYSVSVISNSSLNQTVSGGGRNVMVYGHATQSFSGYGFTEGHRVGVFGMYGQAPTVANAASASGSAISGAGQASKTFYRLGVDASTTALDGNLNLFGAYMFSEDSKDLFSTQGVVNAQAARWHGGFVEADYNITTPLVVYYRYDLIRNTRQGDSAFEKKFGDVDAHTLAFRHHFLVSKRMGAAFHAEYSYIRTAKTGAFNDDQIANVFFTGVDLAF
ncbi:MAG: hypothetical protein KF854_10410 [Nitrospira sp.]|nr:hypothetical protein [Nitrospira sp.]